MTQLLRRVWAQQKSTRLWCRPCLWALRAGRAGSEFEFIHTPREYATWYSSGCGHRREAAPTLPFLQGITRKTSWWIETTLMLIILTPQGQKYSSSNVMFWKDPKYETWDFTLEERNSIFAGPRLDPLKKSLKRTSTGTDRSGSTECVFGLLDHLEHALAKRRNIVETISLPPQCTVYMSAASLTWEWRTHFCLCSSDSLGEQSIQPLFMIVFLTLYPLFFFFF